MSENLLLASGEPGGSSSSVATNAESAKPKKGSWLDTLNMNPKMYWPKKYRYTIEPTPGSVAVLSVRERDHYESNGYIIVRNLVPKETQRQLSRLLTSAETVDQALSLFANSPHVSAAIPGHSSFRRESKERERATASFLCSDVFPSHPLCRDMASSAYP